MKHNNSLKSADFSEKVMSSQYLVMFIFVKVYILKFCI